MELLENNLCFLAEVGGAMQRARLSGIRDFSGHWEAVISLKIHASTFSPRVDGGFCGLPACVWLFGDGPGCGRRTDVDGWEGDWGVRAGGL